MALRLVQYSEKAIAVFGDTKPLKDKLKTLGGRFNGRLKSDPSDPESEKVPGWIFPNSKRPQIEGLVACPECFTPEPTVDPGPARIVDYSEKAIAVFGDTKPLKDKLKALGGKFNGRLKSDPSDPNCTRVPGWIFAKWRREKVEQLIK